MKYWQIEHTFGSVTLYIDQMVILIKAYQNRKVINMIQEVTNFI